MTDTTRHRYQSQLYPIAEGIIRKHLSGMHLHMVRRIVDLHGCESFAFSSRFETATDICLTERRDSFPVSPTLTEIQTQSKVDVATFNPVLEPACTWQRYVHHGVACYLKLYVSKLVQDAEMETLVAVCEEEVNKRIWFLHRAHVHLVVSRLSQHVCREYHELLLSGPGAC